LPSIDSYLQNKFSREDALFNGEKIFDIDKGQLNVLMVAKLLKVMPQRVYYMLRRGDMPFEKKGQYIVIHLCELEKRFKIKNRTLLDSKIS